MTTTGPNFGVLATAHVLGAPAPVSGLLGPDVPEAARRALLARGYRRYHRAPDGTGVTDLAVEAATRAIEKAGVEPGRIDLLVLALTDLSEYLYWDAAAAVQARLGAHRAEAVLLTQACSCGVVAFDAVAGKLATHPAYRTAVLVGANRVCEPYWDRAEAGTSVSSDGAAAAVLVRDHPHLRWRVTEVLTDGRYAGLMRMPGGTAHPFTPADPAIPTVGRLADRTADFFAGDGRATYQYAMTVRARHRTVLDRACARIGITTDDLARVIYLHDTGPAFTELAAVLDIPVELTNRDLALDAGHLGAADQIYSLEQHLARDELISGDTVALLSIGTGMHWACTLLTV
ncbi:3-oxoacyl-ACP synthase III family protein [Micromonospora chersina]|uniref:3-oxoacyl-ACP synthase III family protein n=1 Tax=Micromonospora chersina TaxID=47854 RepID=UPI00370FD78C